MKIQVLASPESWHYLDLQSAAARFGTRVKLEAESFANLGVMLNDGRCSSDFDADVILARAMPGGSLEQVVFRMDALMSLVTAGIRVVNSPKAIEAAVDKFLTSGSTSSRRGYRFRKLASARKLLRRCNILVNWEAG